LNAEANGLKIAIITPFLPSKATAGKKFLLSVIKGLSINNEIFLISRIEPLERATVEELERYCKIVCLHEFKTPKKRNLIGILRIILSYLVLAMKAKKAIRQLDVDINQVSFYDLGVFLHKTRSIKTPMVLDTHDVNTLLAQRKYRAARGLWQKMRSAITLLLTWGAERYTLKRFDLITTKSPSDTLTLKKFDLKVPVVTVRQPVETSAEVPAPFDKRDANSLFFIGAMHRELNVMYVHHFYEEILPIIRKRVGEVVFYVVGDNPPDELIELSKKDDGLKVTGFVEDLTPLYDRAMVFVSPILIGGGVMVKNLEAMAKGLPVVTTTFGNEGIGAVPGRDLLVADNPKDFAECVIGLLEDKRLHEMISGNSIAFIQKNFAPGGVIKTIEQVYRSLVKGM
jgi:glycosyltransferase involved in cell wall biosynthesis